MTNNITSQARKILGTGGARNARNTGYVPVSIYAKGFEPVSVSLPAREFGKELRRPNYRTSILEIVVDGKTILTLPKEVQYHPLSCAPVHADFLKVEKGQPIRVKVKVELTDLEKSPGLKKGGVLNIIRREIEVFSNPESIPEKITISLDGLKIGASIHSNDITFPAGVSTVLKRNFTICAIGGRSEKEEEATTTGTGPVIATDKKADAKAAAPKKK
jgi:large subunit ribosomal protein L25